MCPKYQITCLALERNMWLSEWMDSEGLLSYRSFGFLWKFLCWSLWCKSECYVQFGSILLEDFRNFYFYFKGKAIKLMGFWLETMMVFSLKNTRVYGLKKDVEISSFKGNLCSFSLVICDENINLV